MPEAGTPPLLDRAAGMTVYATPYQGPVSGTIRSNPEDFRVEEVIDLGEVSPERSREFPIPVYSVRKRGMDTPHAAAELARALKSNVNFAGMKDSNAVTTQYASARSVRAEDPPLVSGSRFEAERVGYLGSPINRGMLSGNRFTIAVATRDDISGSVREVYSRCASRSLPNYFGYQRFGLKGMVNHLVGREIVKRNFEQAVTIFLATPRRGEGARGSEARGLAREERWREAAQAFSPGQDLERRIASHLADRPGDYLGGLRRVPMTTRKLFVQAYQSFVFNRTLSSALEVGVDISRPERGDNWAEVAASGLGLGRIHGVKEPFVAVGTVALVQMVGYAYRNYGSRFDPLILGILEEEGVEPSMFYIKEAEELSSEGTFRQAPLLVKDTIYDPRESRPILTFTLGKGEYATTLLREVLKPEDPYLAGF